MTPTAPAARTLWVGTYQRDGAVAGSGEGVWRVDVGPDGRFGTPHLATTLPAPSFLALHPSGRTLYAVGETDPGTLTALDVVDAADDPEAPRLVAAGSLASGGSFPCHVAAGPDAVWVANYGDGVAAVVPVDPATGAFRSDGVTAFPHAGGGPRTDRQDGPHAHSVTPAPAPRGPRGASGTGTGTGTGAGDSVLVADVGTDELRRYPAEPWKSPSATLDLALGGSPSARASDVAAILPPGAGARHVAVLPDGVLVVVGELDARLHVLVPDGARWAHAGAYPATAATTPDGLRPAPSHVALAGDLLTVGVRGADLLAVHRVRPAAPAGSAPTLEHLADVPLGAGAWPRHHAVVADGGEQALVVVANQGTSELAAVVLDRATGTGSVVGTLGLPTPPACVLEA